MIAEVASRYDTWAEKSMYGKKHWGVTRSTFIVAPDGRVAKVLAKVQPKTHDEAVLAALARTPAG